MHRIFTAAAAAACALLTFAHASAAPEPPLPAAVTSFEAGTMHVDVYGVTGKPAIVFIPGLTCGPWEFSREIAQFSHGYTVYAVTLPGFDGQPAAKTQTPFETVSSDFWTMLQAHDIVKPVIVGHSLGGTLAIDLAEQHPDRLTAIVAADGLPVFPGFETMPAAQRAQAAERLKSMMSSVTSPAQFEMVEKMYVLPALMTSAQDIAAVAPLVAKSDPQASGVWAAEDTSIDLRPGLKNITVPLLEIAPYDKGLQGSHFKDAAALKTYYASLLAGAPHAQIEVVENSRHFMMYDRPERFDGVLSAFVKGEQPGA
jgi:pimeloyl-ACP methyl ester carboxylesterase